MFKSCLVALLLISASLSSETTPESQTKPTQAQTTPALSEPSPKTPEPTTSSESPAAQSEPEKSTPVQAKNPEDSCPKDTHWVWSDRSSYKGDCYSNSVVDCQEYETFHGECILCESSYNLVRNSDTLSMECSKGYTTNIVIAVLIILLMLVTLIVVRKYREAREVSADYYDYAKVYATPLRMATPNDANLNKEKDIVAGKL